MSIDQAQLERKLAERRRAAEIYQARLEAMARTQITQVAQMLRGALFELTVLQKNPGVNQDDINLVSHRHAKRIIDVVTGIERY